MPDEHSLSPRLLTSPARPTRSWTLPSLRQVWFQVHWLIGITAGSVLIVIGVTGAVLSFHEEILDAINPGVRQVAVRPVPALSPAQLAQAVAQAKPHDRVVQITVFARPGAAARVGLAPPAGQRRGETVYLDPYSGALQPALHGADFFEWVEQLHRWLLLPRDAGRVVAGTLATGLLVMALSGLYLRWPRRPLAWRAWLTFDVAARGRPFLWGLHAVAGTLALVMYLVSTSTGIYWAFDVVRATVDGWAGVARVERARPARGGGGEPAAATAPVAIGAAWTAFTDRAGDWQLAQIRIPERPLQPIEITWLASDAPHERARSRMVIRADTGEVESDERHASGSTGKRALATIYPLHMGTYFGLPGRLLMMLAALMLPVFAVTGWMMYLGRRTQKRAVRQERHLLTATAEPLPTTLPPDRADPFLVVYATQTGHAERLALRSAGLLQRGGVPVDVRSLGRMTPDDLAGHARVLIVAASFGEGDPPDGVRRFMRQLVALPAARLAGMRYGLLALGDRNYARFCGFGHALDDRLQALGAAPLFPLIEVHDGDAEAVARWTEAIADLAGVAIDAIDPIDPEPGQPWQRWTLAGRTLLNDGSSGGPLYEIALTTAAGASWRPGTLIEIMPPGDVDGASPLPRRYSVASLPEDGALQLLVRQERHAYGLGLASGWLTAHASPGEGVDLRFVDNPGFAPVMDDTPCLYIGNGSGLAGLRAHLRDRVRSGRRRNWLVFGERQRAHDRLCHDELQRWVDQGFLPRLDLAFSRDGDGLRYVQGHLRAAAVTVRAWVDEGAVVFVCGSLQGMAGGVDEALTDILGRERMDVLIDAGRYRRDVY